MLVAWTVISWSLGELEPASAPAGVPEVSPLGTKNKKTEELGPGEVPQATGGVSLPRPYGPSTASLGPNIGSPGTSFRTIAVAMQHFVNVLFFNFWVE